MSNFKLSTKVADKNTQRNLYDIQDKINELQNLIESLSSKLSGISKHTHTRSQITDWGALPFGPNAYQDKKIRIYNGPSKWWGEALSLWFEDSVGGKVALWKDDVEGQRGIIRIQSQTGEPVTDGYTILSIDAPINNQKEATLGLCCADNIVDLCNMNYPGATYWGFVYVYPSWGNPIWKPFHIIGNNQRAGETYWYLTITQPDGNVGINNPTPSQKLDVGGNIKANTAIFNNLTSGYLPYHTGNGLVNSVIYTDGSNVGIGTTNQFGDGAGVIGIANAATVPTSNPFGAHIIYSENDVLKSKHSSGRVTQIAPHIKARAYLRTSQIINNATWTLVNIDTISFDTDSGWNTTTHKYTIPKSGHYLIVGRVSWGNIQAGRYIISVNDGSDRTVHEDQFPTASNYIAMSFSDILYFSQNAQVGLYAYQNTGTNTPAVYAGQTRTFLAFFYLSE